MVDRQNAYCGAELAGGPYSDTNPAPQWIMAIGVDTNG